MAEIVNLRRARKAKARVIAATTADTNRAAYGRAKSERVTTQAQVDRHARTLDGAKREP